jgi:hypothetical protein
MQINGQLSAPLSLLLQTKLGKSNAICSTGMLLNERSQAWSWCQ